MFTWHILEAELVVWVCETWDMKAGVKDGKSRDEDDQVDVFP